MEMLTDLTRLKKVPIQMDQEKTFCGLDNPTRFEKGCITFTILFIVGMIAGAIYFGLTMRQADLIEKNEQLRAEQERAKLELMEENERLRDREILRSMYANQKEVEQQLSKIMEDISK